MGVYPNAIVQHNLTAAEIVSLDGVVVDPIFGGRVPTPLKSQTDNINPDFLATFWSRYSDYYINNPWNGDDLPVLRNEEISIFFWTPLLLSITPFFRFSFYQGNEASRLKFNDIVSKIAQRIDASDVIIIKDSYCYEAFDEHNGLTVAEIKKGVVAKNLPYFEIDF